MLIISFRKVILKFLKSFSVHLTAMFMYFWIYFVKTMINFLSSLKCIKFKINILSGLPSI